MIIILKLVEAASPVLELCCEHCINNAPFYNWRSKLGCMVALLIVRMDQLKEKNHRFKKIYVEQRLEVEIVAEPL